MALRPGKYDPMKPDIELFDYKSKKRYGLKLEGSGALQIGTISQDDSVHIRTAGKRVGDFDEQRSWKGGRGIDKLSDNPEGFWDSQNAWTLSSGRVHQTLLWRFGRGIYSADSFLPDKTHSVTFRPLVGSSRYLQIGFSSSGLTASFIRMWIRKSGTPGTLTFELRDASSVLKTATVSSSDIADTVSKFHKFTLSSTESLTASTTYYIRIYGASTDNKANHWEVGGYNGGLTGTQSSNGTDYVNASFDPYYHVTVAEIARRWFTFFLDTAMYVVDRKDDGTTASVLYINGDRGLATSGQSDGITQSTKSWVVDRWAGAWVKIVRGTGAGQVREILSNTATKLVVSGWLVTPDSTSEYVIYGTEWFTEVATTGLSVLASSPIVVNQIVYFPQTPSVTRKMVWKSSNGTHSFSDDGTNKSSFLCKTTDPDAIRIWSGYNDVAAPRPRNVAYATAVSWSEAPSNLTFGTPKSVGDSTYDITGLLDKDNLLYIFKEDGVWTTDLNMKLVKLQSGIEKTPSPMNGVGSIAHQQFIYYSWNHSLIRVYGSSHDDIGQDWSGYGLPDGREGVFSSLDNYISLLIVGVDSGEGTSSVLGWDGLGWHELLRAYDSGLRIRMVKVQVNQGTRNRTWTDIGGNLVFQEMPYLKGSPWLDSGVRYMHEAVLESSAIDMGTASNLPKYIKEIVVSCDNLGIDNRIEIDYQVDEDVHTNNWTSATTILESPEGTAFFGLNNIRKFAYRLRILSSDNTTPVDIRGVVPNGYARVPYKMVWTLRCKADNITSRGRLVKPDELMRWLLDNARFPGRLEMLSQYQLAHKFAVIVHPPRMFPFKPAQNGQAEESVFTLVLEEA